LIAGANRPTTTPRPAPSQSAATNVAQNIGRKYAPRSRAPDQGTRWIAHGIRHANAGSTLVSFTPVFLNPAEVATVRAFIGPPNYRATRRRQSIFSLFPAP